MMWASSEGIMTAQYTSPLGMTILVCYMCSTYSANMVLMWIYVYLLLEELRNSTMVPMRPTSSFRVSAQVSRCWCWLTRWTSPDCGRQMLAVKDETKARKKQRTLVKMQTEAKKNKEGHLYDPGAW